MKDTLVAIVMGSDSDIPVMKEAAAILEKFNVSYEMTIRSAHRAPLQTAEFAKTAADRGVRVIIAGAGGAAHLAGVIASHTILPVIGVPLNATPLNGQDALFATVQMPAGIPVATVAIGKPGAINAAILAVEILALGDIELAQKLFQYKTKMTEKVLKKAEKLENDL